MGRGHKLKPSKEKEVKPRTYAILIEPQWHLPAVEVAEHRSARLQVVVDRRLAKRSAGVTIIERRYDVIVEAVGFPHLHKLQRKDRCMEPQHKPAVC